MIKLLILCFVLFSCSNIPQKLSEISKEKWSGYVYPNRYDLGGFISIKQTGSLEDCRDEAIKLLLKIGQTTPAKYNCELDCGYIGDQLPFCKSKEEFFVILKEFM